ncbi:AI-2E family transporter [Salinirubellus salinus]|uniref:AI-2E family transporter n=1 Tax=Salinirubellus salinus TaxID=1364945 RepID=A0A9E7UAG1_9EURY|nr:AI-2E family transporter [Salinirubellus salinus]UWM53749.1 AI-2E family transporter [Salinirubellus salinus]
MSDDPTATPGSAPTADVSDGGLRAALTWLLVDRKRAALWTVTFALVAALVYVGWRYVGTLAIALFVYYVTRPVFRRVHGRIEGRTTAVGVTLIAVALPLLIIVGWAFAILASALTRFLDSDSFDDLGGVFEPYLDVQAYLTELPGFVAGVLEDPSTLSDIGIPALVGDVWGSLVAWAGTAFNAGIHAFIVLIVVFYLLRDDYRIARWARTTVLEEGGVVDRYVTTVDRDLHNVYFGNILNAILTGVLASVVYLLLNLVAPTVTRIPEAAFLGILVGVASLVPVIGIKLVTWPVAGYLLARALLLDPTTVWFPVVFLAVSFVVVDYIPDQLLRPYVSGRTLHVGAVMLAYTLGPLLFGWYGIFLAPLLFVVIFEFGRIVFPWLLDPERVEARLAEEGAGPPDVEPESEPGPEPESGESPEGPGDDAVTGADDD